MTTNHTAQTLITYGSQYGSTEHYARKFAACTGFPVLLYREAKHMADYARGVHFGALYAGGVLGLRQIAAQLSPEAELILVTVGLSDEKNPENIQNIRSVLRRQLPENVFRRAQIFHLRGAIDYGKLSLRHRAMMALLYAKAKGLPAEERNAETQALIETYGKSVSFVDDTTLMELANRIERG